MWGLTATGLGILVFCVVSGRLKDGIVTPPMVFVVFGLAIGAGGLHLVDADLSHGTIHTLAEITLGIVLFSDAARIDLRVLVRDHNLPLRMLAIGMPLTIALGSLLAWILPLGLGLVEAALLAAVLTPTDAALGQAVISDKNVPVRIRQTLNVESGLNDGIAVPFVYVLAALLATTEHAGSVNSIFVFAALQLLLGPLAGILVGGIAAWSVIRASANGWMSAVFEGPFVLASAALAFGFAEALGGNGFISVFVAGLIFGHLLDGRCKFILEFAEAEGQILILLAFLVFGAVMLPELSGQLSWSVVLYAVLSLTIIRMLPIALSLVGTGISIPTMGFLGWFGPRGLASILFGLLVVEQVHSDGAKIILTTAIVTIAISVFAHGVTAAPLARWYSKMAKQQGDCPENEIVSEMPLRSGNPNLTQ